MFVFQDDLDIPLATSKEHVLIYIFMDKWIIKLDLSNGKE